MCDSRVILLVEIRRQSLLKVKVLSITWGHEKGGGRGGVVVEDFACVTIKLMYLISRSGSVIFPPHWSLIDRQFPIVPPVQSVGGDWSPLLPFLLKTMWSPKSSPHPWRWITNGSLWISVPVILSKELILNTCFPPLLLLLYPQCVDAIFHTPYS